MRLNDKSVIITGAGSGIGKACAQLFNKEGAKIILADINEEDLNKTKETLSRANESLTYKCDVSSKKETKDLVNFSIKSLSSVDILINSAGVNPRNAPKGYDFEQIWDWVIDVNLKGSFLMSHFVVE